MKKESIGYDTKITRGEDLLTGYSKCTKLDNGKIYAGGTTVARQVVKSVQIAVSCRTCQRRRHRNGHIMIIGIRKIKIPIEQCQIEHCMWKADIITVSVVRMLLTVM